MHMSTVCCTNVIMYATHLVETCLNYHLVCHTIGEFYISLIIAFTTLEMAWLYGLLLGLLFPFGMFLWQETQW